MSTSTHPAALQDKVATTRKTARIDTSDMYAVHNVFRHACRDAAVVVGAAGRGDDTRGQVVALYEHLLAMLHLHHEGEDAILWPLLQQRCPAHRDLVARMDAQHKGVIAALAFAEGALARWKESATPSSSSELVSALGDLGVALAPHLDEEETHILPLAAENLTSEEWGSLPAHAMARFKGDKRWLVMGLVRDQMTEEGRAHMLAGMPPQAAEAWTKMGSPAYAEFMARLGYRPKSALRANA